MSTPSYVVFIIQRTVKKTQHRKFNSNRAGNAVGTAGRVYDKIPLESTIVEGLGVDYLDVVELLMALEKETGKMIPEDKITEIKTVGDLMDVIAAL